MIDCYSGFAKERLFLQLEIRKGNTTTLTEELEEMDAPSEGRQRRGGLRTGKFNSVGFNYNAKYSLLYSHQRFAN